MGKALLGHQVGDEVAVSTPGGVLRFQIVGIE
jgi:transcription elongation GreA/GreB family factor